MVAGLIIGCILMLVVFWFSAEEFYQIAVMKGHSQRKYFWWSFFTPPLGMLMVVALPDRRDIAPAAEQNPDDRLPAL